jgi:hypothetical protein
VLLLQVEKDQFEGLFKKTVTTPFLYWLPLTKQQVLAKQNNVQQVSETAKPA